MGLRSRCRSIAVDFALQPCFSTGLDFTVKTQHRSCSINSEILVINRYGPLRQHFARAIADICSESSYRYQESLSINSGITWNTSPTSP